MKIVFDQSTLDLTPNGKAYKAALGNKTVDVEIIRAENGRLDLLIEGKQVATYVSDEGTKRWVTVNGQTFVLTKSSGEKRGGAGHDHKSELAAPMPGQVRSVNVKEGDTVTKGQTLMILEAMKMEIRIQAPFDGIVRGLMVKVGQTVEREQMLVKMEAGS
ncbi:MAG TPA: biotin/lipoyl-containing protein [Anaerolineales bacterium]|jgi:acetyl/propionyl-CoA carboxylase alpha subunit|nr:biotin/lipoyl-containing protein [Anaerolineales bacterium]